MLVLGATGTIGRATVRALVACGHDTVCLVRHSSEVSDLDGAAIILGDACNPDAAFSGGRFDTIVSCLASRTGAPRDAWAVDYGANLAALRSGQAAGVAHFVLLSAICVQRPRLAFQHAKLAFEAALTGSGIDWTIVRPTAFFKSLSGQVERVRAGKAFLVFGDGTLTACKPISDSDLADYLADCLDDITRRNRILPIGGPGPAITPRDQAALLGKLLDREVRMRRVPVALLDTIIAALSLAGHLVPRLADKAELARIGRYYATESMLLLDPITRRYDADATPVTGALTLADHYARLLRGEVRDERGDHAVF